MKNRLPNEAKKWIKRSIALAIVTFLLVNPLNISFVASLNAQEWFLYHVRDAATYFFNADTGTKSDYYLATGTYEQDEKDEWFGVAENKNLIILQLESFQNIMVNAEYEGQEITPNMNAWLKETGSVYFDNFYQQIASGNTSDAEFAVNNSIIGAIESFTYRIYQDNYFKGLPWLLKEKDYDTVVMHGFEKTFWNREAMYPAQGFDTFVSASELESDNITGLGGGDIAGISDEAFYEQAVDIMEDMAEDGPFYSFLISLSSHHPFNVPKDMQELKLAKKDKDSVFGNYIHAIHYADYCFGLLLDMLKETALYDESLLVVYGDHAGIVSGDGHVSDWLGCYYNYDLMMNVPLIIHVPESETRAKKISISGGQLDIMPTVAWLMGFETLDTLYMGQNLLTAKSGFVVEKTYLLKGSFIKDDIVFEVSRDGVFENSRAWNRKTRKDVSIDGLKEDYLRATQMIDTAVFYLDEDIMRKLYVEGNTFEHILDTLNSGHTLPGKIELAYIEQDIPYKRVSGEAETMAKSDRATSLSDFLEWMKKNPKKQVLVDSDNMLMLLEYYERNYSGKVGRKGTTYIEDEEAHQQYRDIQSRIIPIVKSLSDWTKVEYMGYKNMVFMPDPENYTLREIKTFIETAHPAGVLLPDEEISEELLSILMEADFVYAMDTERLTDRAKHHMSDIDGIVLTADISDAKKSWRKE